MTDYPSLWHRLTDIYEAREAQAIVRYVLDTVFGLSLTDIYCGKVSDFSEKELILLDKIMRRLEKAEPVQYVVGRTTFMDHSFTVGPGVLIPRPETEELCRWIAAETTPGSRPHLLDVGTGSGCIAISLALAIAGSSIEAWDISPEALTIARANATRLEAAVTFRQQDALQAAATAQIWDVIVSNPPYICEKERAAMHRNVLEYEPATALFVPDDDPLRFYRAISVYATKALRHGGSIYFEINPLYAAETCRLLSELAFTGIILRHDAYGKQRFIKAVYP